MNSRGFATSCGAHDGIHARFEQASDVDEKDDISIIPPRLKDGVTYLTLVSTCFVVFAPHLPLTLTSTS